MEFSELCGGVLTTTEVGGGAGFLTENSGGFCGVSQRRREQVCSCAGFFFGPTVVANSTNGECVFLPELFDSSVGSDIVAKPVGFRGGSSLRFLSALFGVFVYFDSCER